MKRLLLFIYNFFKKLSQPKPEPREYYLSQGPSQSVYRTSAGKSEPEEKSAPSQETEIKPPTLSNMFSQGKGGFPSLTSPRSSFEPLPPLDPFLPLKIKRTDDYIPIKNLNTKATIKVEKVSREDALRLSHLPLTNDMTEVGDDTIHVPILGGKTLHITPEHFVPEAQLKQENEAKIVLEKIIEDKVLEYEKLTSEEEK